MLTSCHCEGHTCMICHEMPQHFDAHAFQKSHASAGVTLSSDNCIRHFCHPADLFDIMHTDDIGTAGNANGDGGGSPLYALVGGQVQCKANERFSGWPQQYGIPQGTDLIEAVDQLKIV